MESPTGVTDTASALRVVADRDACVGHGRCYSLAPAVFGSDDEGFVDVLVERADTPDLQRQARTGVQNCPEHALSVEDA